MNTYKPKKKQTRLLYMIDKRAYHLCTVVLCSDASVIITMPSKAKAVGSFPIDIKDGKPISGSPSNMDKSSIKFSYHPKTGFKHIKETTTGSRLATYNTLKPEDFKDVFQSLLRIFPTYPAKLSFVQKTRKTDVIIPDNFANNGKPISLLFTATTVDKDRTGIAAPKGTVVFPISGYGHFTVLVTLLPLTENDEPCDEWPAMTMWTTPY